MILPGPDGLAEPRADHRRPGGGAARACTRVCAAGHAVRQGLDRGAQAQCASAWPELARVQRYPHNLGGGMRQRVAGAIALACQPQVLIADEPTTSLDVTIQARSLALLKQIQAESVASDHLRHARLRRGRQLCDRVAVMYAGRIVETREDPRHLQSPAPSLRGRAPELPADAPRRARAADARSRDSRRTSPTCRQAAASRRAARWPSRGVPRSAPASRAARRRAPGRLLACRRDGQPRPARGDGHVGSPPAPALRRRGRRRARGAPAHQALPAGARHLAEPHGSAR